ncbi:penicillin-binding protein 2 [Rhodobacteraceae bacterium RKSG542]|uniref:peptidoglycan D,D-transpeptidase FtsI family protein n=1 Tax=Pseudovibrio flavus TaxID=2529854 RepID=UPI0012BC1642|nr:penicillin-binding protein 2 [Pseudovibrio flavus]MTI19139.1 penicillin-binding protein 2 [Pseudovibrio flavus]
MAALEPTSFLKAPEARKKRVMQSTVREPAKSRIIIAMMAFFCVFTVIGGRLVMLGSADTEEAREYISYRSPTLMSRPDILDRNGDILATDIRSADLVAYPKKIPDPDEVFEGLISVLPHLDTPTIEKRLKSEASFVYLDREISMSQRDAIHDLGLPGIGFEETQRRFYPGGNTAAHILGTVDVDGNGISGLEKYIDTAWLKDLRDLGFTSNKTLEPVQLSVDLRVQYAVRDELVRAMEYYKAKAAMGVVLDVHTGEVISMVSLPDYDPNDRREALLPDRLNRTTAGVFEMGSVFKGITVAMALDSGHVNLGDSFDARRPIRAGGRMIDDFHGKKRILSVPEIFTYSSNIGTARMMLAVGIDEQRKFMEKLGLTTPLRTEIPERAMPLLPPRWNEVAAMTISFGHGLSVTPLHTAVAGATLVNGGKFINPTFLPRTEEEASKVATQVISQETSDAVRLLNRMNVKNGSGRRAAVPGYDVGGKTGTSQKVIDGRYAEGIYLNSFLGSFPMGDPQYIVLLSLDEPQKLEGQPYATAGWNVVPTTASVIRRIAPMLGVKPNFIEGGETIAVSY